MLKGYLNTQQVCHLLGIKSQTLVYRVKEKQFPAADMTVGRNKVWDVETVLAHFQAELQHYEQLLERVKQYGS